MHIFDEFSDYFRCPAGAVSVPGEIRLRLKLLRGRDDRVWVSMRRDDCGAADNTEMGFAGADGAYDVYECVVSIDRAGLYWYHFAAGLSADTAVPVSGHPDNAYQVTAYAQDAEAPEWIKGGFIYHIFVDRFRRGAELNLKPGAVYREDWGATPYFLPDERGIVRNNDFFGGDLYGIIEKLPYLKELGVTCIYLSPVFEAASNHKYDTGDYFKIDQAFGGDAAFERLCAEAKGLGIRVILDGVFNHVGSDSRYFNRYSSYDGPGAYQGKQSPYYDWFTFHDDGTYDAWWGIKLLPALNKQNEDYKEFICGKNGVIAFWTKKGVSGWRLDVVDELPDVFLDPLCRAIKRENGDALIVGEVWEDASNKIAYDVRRRYFLGGQLDSVMNYPLKEAIIAFVRDGQAEWLSTAVAGLCLNYPDNVLNSLMNILGTHDTMRILTVLSGADPPHGREEASVFRLDAAQIDTAKRRLKLASALQFTLPGVPCVFYGDEAGVEGCADPFCRSCYPWGKEDTDLIRWYSMLARIRNENECFKSGKYELIEARCGLYAFTRGQGRDRVLVAVNVSDGLRQPKTPDFNFDLINNEYTETLTVKSGQAAIFAVR